jgi:hypothetical protein
MWKGLDIPSNMTILSHIPSRNGPVHVATIESRQGGRVYVTHLLRRTYREAGKVKHETLGNISHLPDHVIEMIRGIRVGKVINKYKVGKHFIYKVTKTRFSYRRDL